MKATLFVELCGNQTNMTNMIDKAKEIWKSQGNKPLDLKNVTLYYKPEENRCYYVFNDNTTGESFEV